MRGIKEDTPPSSVSGDEIQAINDEDGMFYVDEMEEIQLDDEEMSEVTEQDEEIDLTEPLLDFAALVFSKHEGSVFCCDLHPSGKLAVTGGEDDKAYVWDVETGDVLMNCVGHKDSVIFVGFSHDGTLLATADMSGLIKVWTYTSNRNELWPTAFEYEADDLTWGLWHFGARVLMMGSVTGDIYVFKLPSGEIKVLQGHNTKVECGKLLHDGVRLAAGYEDGAVKIWDLKTSTVLHQVTADSLRVTAIDTHPEDSLIASISAEGRAVLITPNNGKIVGQLETGNDLETVAFAPDSQMGLLALGTLTGSVTIWDVAKQMVRHHCSKIDEDTARFGVTKILWIKNELVTGCLDGAVRVYEGKTGDIAVELTGHRSEILDLCYNAKENLVLTTSDDGTARIFKYQAITDND